MWEYYFGFDSEKDHGTIFDQANFSPSSEGEFFSDAEEDAFISYCVSRLICSTPKEKGFVEEID